MAEQTTLVLSKRMKLARNLSIASLVIAIIMVVSCLNMCLLFAAGAQEMSASPDEVIASLSSDTNATLGMMLGGTGLSEAEAIEAALVVLALFFGAGAVLNLFPIAANIAVLKTAKRPNERRIPYILSIVGAVVAFLTSNPVNGILLVIISYNMHKDYIDTVGEEVAYKNGKRLGFMRFMTIWIVLDFAYSVIWLIFTTKSDYVAAYDAIWWVEFVGLIIDAVSVWFILKRKQHGREVIMATSAFYIALYLIVGVATQNGMMSISFVFELLLPIFELIYFGTAKRPRAIFTEPFKTDSREKQLAEDEKLWNPKSWRFWRNLLLYFCVFSVIGHWMEWAVCWIIRIGLEYGIHLGTYDPNSGIWSNMLNPFFVYGAALVLIGLLLFPMKNLIFRKIHNKYVAFVVDFVFNMALIAALELAIGLTQNCPPDPVTGKLPLWDYNDMPFNFMGQICLLNTTFFTIMATLFTYLVYPNLERVSSKVPDDVMNIITVAVLVFFVLVVAMYVVNIPVSSV